MSIRVTPFDRAAGQSASGGAGGGTGTPVSGDLGGTTPAPVVTGWQGRPLCADAPATGDVYVWDGSEWCPAPPVASGLDSITDGSTTITPVTDLTVPPHSLSGSTPNAEIAWDRLHTVAAAGSTETLDLADGDTFDVTLTADCTITLAGATAARSSAMTVVTRQDGTGGWDLTWPGSVSWLGGVAPTPDTAAGAVNVYVLWSFDGGTTWGGTLVGSGSGGATFDATPPANVGGVGVASAVGVAATVPHRDHVHALTYHDESLTDGASGFIFAGGDVVTVTGVPN